MLLSPFFYYIIDFFLFTVLAYDTLGYLVTVNRGGKVEKEDYGRLIFTWIFTLEIKCICSMFSFLPLSTELFTLLNIYVTLPVVGGSNKLKKMLIDDKLLCGLCEKFGLCGGTKCNEECDVKKEE